MGEWQSLRKILKRWPDFATVEPADYENLTETYDPEGQFYVLTCIGEYHDGTYRFIGAWYGYYRPNMVYVDKNTGLTSESNTGSVLKGGEEKVVCPEVKTHEIE